MVARIIIGKKLRGALHYNEQKVSEGQAALILASGFAGNIEQMNFQQKLQRFEHLLQLKPSVKTNTLHISLNFDAIEKLEDDTLQKIAIAYMEKIGFGDQPYLAYRHYDAAHDHLHLVTTNIQASGTAIDLHGIGWQRSAKAREEIEQEFNLVKAKSQKYKREPGIKPVDPEKALYGQIPTKRAISNTVNAVMASYRFTSLAEFNAILRQFNVTADRGAEDSPMFRNKGLIYSVLDNQGQKTGVPIKASSLYTKPTLPNLEKRFDRNREQRQPFKPGVRARIDRVLNTGKLSERAFTANLKQQGIAVLFRRTEAGQTYGITFVDHQTKTVFNGSDLGKAYSAKTITSQFMQEPALQKANFPLQMSTPALTNSNHQQALPNPLESLLAPVSPQGPSLTKKKRRKKKKLKI
ncbi:MAG TPA: relaxase/mobilization nuclease domain-containing protein [Mucilaginibacter sp.]|nr:relaxase/mobilization nuclease domain-containing protein [Mucilaginibacter sp.]